VSERARVVFLVALLAATVAITIRVRSEKARAEDPEFTGELDLGHGVSVRRVDLTDPPLHLVLVRVPRRKGLRLRAVSALGLAPVREMVERAAGIAAVNGDYHEMHGYLQGKTYSTLVEGGDPSDLGRYRVVVGPRPDGEASFWLDLDRVPHIGPLELGGTLGLDIAARQGFHDRRADVDLVSEPLLERTGLEGEVAFPLERAGDGFRVVGPARRRIEGPSLVVRDGAIASVATAVHVGATVRLSVEKRVDLAIGTGPWLLRSGEIPPRVFEGNDRWSAYPRTAVGYNAGAVFLVATLMEARNRGSMVDLARALQKLGCTDALNLDGGPSTQLYAAGRYLSSTPRFAGMEDPVGSALVVVLGTEGVDDVR
jgi:hypothetical protein